MNLLIIRLLLFNIMKRFLLHEKLKSTDSVFHIFRSGQLANLLKYLFFFSRSAFF